MNILNVLDGFKIGGIEAQAFEIINNFPIRDNKNFIFNLSPEINDFRYKFESLLINKKLKVIAEPNKKSSIFLIYSIYKFCTKNSIDTLIIYPCNKKMIYVILGAKLAGIHNIFIHIGTALLPKKNLDIFKLKILFGIFEFLDVFLVAASKHILNSLNKFYFNNKKKTIIYNSCDTLSFKNIAKEARTKNKSNSIKSIVMVARLDSFKDHETLIRAFAMLKYPNWNLKIVGKGEYYNYLRKLSLNLSLNPDEIFVGSKNNIPEILGEAEIFAFSTTEEEGFGKVLIEAMAANLPIIATDVSACREVLCKGKAGLLVKARDIKDWEKNLKKLIEDVNLRNKLKKNSSELVKKYDSKNIAINWEFLLKKELKIYNKQTKL